MSQIKIVKGNDAPIQWRVSYQGQPLDLTGKAVTLYVINSRGPFQLKSFEVEGNVVTATYYGADQARFGEHSLVLRLNEGRPEMSTVSVKEAFELVEWSKDQGGESGEPIKVTPIILEADVAVAQGGGGGVSITPDWNASEGEEGYIKNRTHYSKIYQKTQQASVFYVTKNDTLKIAGEFFDGLAMIIQITNSFGEGAAIITKSQFIEMKKGTPAQVEVAFTNGKTVNYEISYWVEPYHLTYGESIHIDYAQDSDTPENETYDLICGLINQLSDAFIPDTIARQAELTELSLQVGTLSERVDALGEGGSVFEAVYGETSYDEIKEAFEANKVVYCYRETRVYMLTKLEAGAAYFAVTHGNYYYRLVCHPGAPSTSWGATSENFQHSLKSLANGNAQITIAGNTAEVATPQYVENLLGVIINGEY